MQRIHTAIRARGVEVVAIGQGTAEEAEEMCRSVGVEFACVGDPGKESYRAFGLPRVESWAKLLFNRDALRAGRAVRKRGDRFDVSIRGSLKAHSDWFQLPGLAIVDGAGVLRYYHRARHTADFPGARAILQALEALPA
jgi:hypothetical protein